MRSIAMLKNTNANRGWVLAILVLGASCASTPEWTEPPAWMYTQPTAETGAAAARSEPASSLPAVSAHDTVPASSLDAGFVQSAASAQPGTAAPTQEPAQPEEYPDRFMLRGGLFYFSRLRTNASLDSKNSPLSATIDFDRTLGLDTSNLSGRLDGVYRFTDHSAIGASWYSFNLSGSRMIDKQIEWNGMTYPINAQVDTFFDQNIYVLDYRYSFYHNRDIEFGASAGFNVQYFHIGLSAPGIGQAQTEHFTIPLPVLGTFVNYNFTPRLQLNGQYQFFFLDFDNASGSLQDFIVGLEYRLFKNLSFGGAFDFYTMNASYTSSSSILGIDQSWHAFMLYASMYF
jgi:hypothetical protein